MTVIAQKLLTRSGDDLRHVVRMGRGVAWLQIAEEPFIFVSEEGEVASLCLQPGRILRASLSGEYPAVKVAGVTRHVHRLVAETFLGPPPFARSEVRHLDGNRMNPRLSNLAWGTPRQNSADKVAHGTDGRGERNPQAKLTRAKVKRMRDLRGEGRTFKSIAEEYGVAPMTAHRAITGGTWK